MFEIKANKWFKLPELPIPLGYSAAVVLEPESLYNIGGTNSASVVRLLKLSSPRASWREFTLGDVDMRWEMQFAVECEGKIICSDSFFGRKTFVLEKKTASEELEVSELVQSNHSNDYSVNAHSYNFKVFRGEVYAMEPTQAAKIFRFKPGATEWFEYP